MKVIAHILALYVLVLSVMPCSHDPECNTSKYLTELNSVSHRIDTDHCSPFCNCNCCSSPVVYQHIVLHFDYFSFQDKPYFSTIQGKVKSHFISFWQPPKIG